MPGKNAGVWVLGGPTAFITVTQVLALLHHIAYLTV